jgi:hypothetical protein
MSWGWPEGIPRKEGGPYDERIDLRVDRKIKEGLDKLAGKAEISEFIRNLLRGALDALDPPGQPLKPTITVDDWFRIYENKVGEPVIPVKWWPIAIAGALTPLLAVGSVVIGNEVSKLFR